MEQELEAEQSTDATQQDAVAHKSYGIEGLADLLDRLKASSEEGQTEWYRGHSSVDFLLLPSIARPPCDVEAEATLIKRFKQNAFPFLKGPPASAWDWLFLMQHHGAPTRLLDWSDSPLTALWFAVASSESDDEKDACVWVLRPIELNEEARLKPPYHLDIPLFGEDSELDNYLPDRLQTMTANTPAAGIASRQFSRVVAQMGSFTVTGREQIALEDISGSFLTQYVIPAAAKPSFRQELLALRITRLAIFPELSNVARLAQEGLWPISV
jgi:hypothetical protein